MAQKLSQRLAEIVEALPLKPDIRILEIGCGTGAVAREIAQRIGDGYILGIDRSSKAIGQALKSSEAEILKGNLSFRRIEIENFELEQGEGQFDIAFAVRVGALDGRHPDRKSTRLNSSHVKISYAVFCLKKKNQSQRTA